MGIGPFAGWRAEVSSWAGYRSSVGEKLLQWWLATHEHLLASRLHSSSLAFLPSPKLAVTSDLRGDFQETFYFLAVAPMLMSGSLIGINKCNE